MFERQQRRFSDKRKRLLAVAVLVAASLSTGLSFVVEQGTETLAASRSWSYDFNTSGATWTVPFGVSSITVSAFGGAAGSGGSDGRLAGSGGQWGYVQATMSVSQGDIIGLYPGNSGSSGTGCVTSTGAGVGGADSYPSGNYNGGNGGNAGSAGCSGGGGGGGAASVVTRNSAIQIVAAGAGGGGGANNVSNSGSGITGSLIAGTTGGTGADGWACSVSNDGGGSGGGGGGANGGAGGVALNDTSECKGSPGSAGSNFVASGLTVGANTTSSSSAETITITYTPTSVSTPALAASSDTGSSNSDRITSATSLTFTGTATGGSTVQLRANGVNTGSTCTANVSTGAWTCTTSTLSGTPSITAVATIDGESVTSSATSVTIDTTAPTATVTTAFAQSSSSVSIQSSEIGTAYIVRSTVVVSSLSSITSAADSNWNAVSVTSANTATSLSLSGLSDGTYRIYSVDVAGNLSAASSGVITIDSVAPTVSVSTGTITNLSSATVQSSETGTAYLVRNSVVVTGVADITAADGNLWNSVAISAANTATSLSASGLIEGVYVAYSIDAAGNFSSVSVGSVTVTLTSQSNFVVTGAPATLGYLGTVTLGTSGGNGNGAVSYVSTTPLVCSVNSGSGVVTMLSSSGTCSIGVTKAADISYYAASASVDISAVKALQEALSISGSTTAVFGDVISLTATGGTTAGEITWSDGSSSACSVDDDGVVTVSSGVGTCDITVTMAGSSNYEPVSSSVFTITISKAAQSALTVTSTEVIFGQTLTLTAVGGSGTGTLLWSIVSGTCTLVGDVVTPGNAGSACVVRVTRAGDGNYLSKISTDTTITVQRASQVGFSITSSTTFLATSTLNLTASGGQSTEAVTWSVTSGVCTVSGSILSSAQGAVTCVVTAIRPGGTNYLAATDSVMVTVNKSAQSTVSITGAPATLGYLGSVSLGTNGGSGTGAVSYVSTTPQVCWVNSGSGVVTMLVSSGNCSIGVTKASDNLYLAASANVDLVAIKAFQSPLAISGTSAGSFGETISLSVAGGSTSGAVVWSVGVSTACTVSSSGILSVTSGIGTCNVTATMAGSEDYEPVTSASFEVVVSRALQMALTIVDTEVSYGQTLSLVASGGSGTGVLTWEEVSGTCTINGTTLTVGSAGSTCVIRVKRAGDNNYDERFSVDTTINIVRANQTGFLITNSNNFVTGDSLNLSAMGGQTGGAVTWNVVSGVCTLSGTTLTSSRGGVSCVVSATRAGNNNYLAVTESFTVTVDKIAQTLTFRSVAPAQAVVGETYTVSVDSSLFLAATISVTNQSQSICSISAGVVTFLSAGNCVISASQAGTDVFASAAISQTISVVVASPSTSAPQLGPSGPSDSVSNPGGNSDSSLPSTVTITIATTTTTTTTIPSDPTQPQMGQDGQPPLLNAGESTAFVRGQQVNVSVMQIENAVLLSLPNDVQVRIGRLQNLGDSVPVAADGVLRMYRNDTVDVGVEGFVPGTTYTVFMFSDPRELGRGVTDAEGQVAQVVSVPKDVEYGDHTLQVVGVGRDGEIVSVSLGFEVLERASNTVAVVLALGAAVLLALLGGRPIFARRRRSRAIYV
jgi:trimeric autotransporter adhesin